MYNSMQYTNNNNTEYLIRFRNTQKVNEACNGSLITRGVYKSMGKIFHSHISVLDLIIYRKTIIRRKRRKERKCSWVFVNKKVL